MRNFTIRDSSNYVFVAAHEFPADWKETIGYQILKPYYSSNVCFSVQLNPLKSSKINKIHSLALKILAFICNNLGITKMGKFILSKSISHQNKIQEFKRIVEENFTEKDEKSVLNNIVFFSKVDEWSFLEAILEEYASAINSADPNWLTEKSARFLKKELLSLEKNSDQLNTQSIEIIDLYEKKVHFEDLEQLQSLINNFKELKIKFSKLLEDLNKKFPDLNPRETIGLANDGNTCYLNASLQPLLAIDRFPNLIPFEIIQREGESNENFNGRKSILESFKEFIKAYQEKKSAGELGHLVGKLRKSIFKAGLLEGGFLNRYTEYFFQDAGSFFELILHIIGQDLQLDTSKVFKCPDEANHRIHTVESQGLLFLKNPANSLQEKVNAFGNPTQEILKEEDAYKLNEHTKLYEFEETNKITSHSRDILVFKVDNYSIDIPNDLKINCRALYAKDDPSQLMYELTGFLQNHNQVHWTCVVRNEEQWKYCNDNVVKTVNPEDADFKRPASYIVYKRIV